MSRNKVRVRVLAPFVGLLVVVLVAGFGLLGCQSGGEAGSEAQMKTETTSDASVQQEDVIYTCPMHPEVVSNEPGECPTCGMNLVPADEIAGSEAGVNMEGEQHVTYTCPMHPEIQVHEPGECPTCGMNLVPVEAPTEPGADATKEM